MLDSTQLLTCALIIGGRICDVSIGTCRTLFVVQGRRGLASILGFFEVVIWIFVVARVINGISENWLYACCYGLGFAIGNFSGVTIERWLAFGNQALLVFSQEGFEMAKQLRDKGYRLTEFIGRGRDGRVPMLMVILRRQESAKLIDEVKKVDPNSFYILEDIRFASGIASHMGEPTGWRNVLKLK